MAQGLMRSLLVSLLLILSPVLQAADVLPPLTAVEQDRYFQALQRHYPRLGLRQALLAYCNDLLEQHALLAGYRNAHVANDRHRQFRLSIHAPGELTVHAESRTPDARQMEAHSQRVSLYGVDPFVRYRCNPRGLDCVILSPADGSEWLQMLRDRQGAAELARALSYLIRDMQNR